MPVVRNRLTGAFHDVPANHFSVTDPDYEIQALEVHDVVKEEAVEETTVSFEATLQNATDEEIDASILDQGVDIGRASTREGKIKKILEHLGE